MSGLSLTVIPHFLVFVVRIAPSLAALSGAGVRLPAAATFSRRGAAKLATVIVRIVVFQSCNSQF